MIDNPTLEVLWKEVKTAHAFRLFLFLLRRVNGKIEIQGDPDSGQLIGEKAIMEALGFSRSSLYRAKAELEKLGILHREKRGKYTFVHFDCVNPDKSPSRKLITCTKPVEKPHKQRVTDDTQQSDHTEHSVDLPFNDSTKDPSKNSACHKRPYDQYQDSISIPPDPQTGENPENPVPGNSCSTYEEKNNPSFPLGGGAVMAALLRIVTNQQTLRQNKGIPFGVNDIIQDWIADPEIVAIHLTQKQDYLRLQNGKRGTILEVVGRYNGPKRRRHLVKAIKELGYWMGVDIYGSYSPPGRDDRVSIPHVDDTHTGDK